MGIYVNISRKVCSRLRQGELAISLCFQTEISPDLLYLFNLILFASLLGICNFIRKAASH